MMRQSADVGDESVRPVRPLANRIMLCVFIALLTTLLTAEHSQAVQRFDFHTFYLVAKMLRYGEGHQLYDLSRQAAYQMRYVDPSRVVGAPDLPFFYPAATGVLYLPLAWVPLMSAFAIWTAFNLGLLVLSVRFLQGHLRIPEGDRPLFAAVLFIPVAACLLQGQLSIVVLFLYSVAFSYFKRGRPFAAGFVLGIGTLKFQLMLGFFAVLLLRRCWKTLLGVAVGALPVVFVSAAILGWRGAIQYPLTVMHFAITPAAPEKMVTLYGALMTALGHQPPTWLLVMLSVGIIAGAALVRADMDVAFSVAMLASVVVAYHAYIYELTLMLIPAAVIASRLARTTRLLLAFAIGVFLITAMLFFTGALGAAAATFVTIGLGLWYVRSIGSSAAISGQEPHLAAPTMVG